MTNHCFFAFVLLDCACDIDQESAISKLLIIIILHCYTTASFSEASFSDSEKIIHLV